ncbi:hypothetical protein BCR42DRAFT_406431 [Absidia repens]|uniref:Uncharacterized protein n=1 Tax=Absidia repens TaxID=90262 RepID=A0A1X2IUS6_9FUNG|nr:hypothetical protein BCR42DRAFT_406431 [Absidia repens]
MSSMFLLEMASPRYVAAIPIGVVQSSYFVKLKSAHHLVEFTWTPTFAWIRFLVTYFFYSYHFFPLQYPHTHRTGPPYH